MDILRSELSRYQIAFKSHYTPLAASSLLGADLWIISLDERILSFSFFDSYGTLLCTQNSKHVQRENTGGALLRAYIAFDNSDWTFKITLMFLNQHFWDGLTRFTRLLYRMENRCCQLVIAFNRFSPFRVPQSALWGWSGTL